MEWNITKFNFEIKFNFVKQQQQKKQSFNQHELKTYEHWKQSSKSNFSNKTLKQQLLVIFD